MTPTFSESLPYRLEGDVVVALFFEDLPLPGGPAALLDRRLGGVLSAMMAEKKVSGRVGEQILVRGRDSIAADWVFFAGGGLREGLCIEAYRGLLRHLLQTLRRAGFRRIALGLESLPGVSTEECRRTVSELVESEGDGLHWAVGIESCGETENSERVTGRFGSGRFG